jgi:integrase
VTSRRHFGSVRKRPSGRYEASYWHGGERRLAPNTFMTKSDALAYLSGVETDVHRGAWIDPRRAQISLSDYSDHWLSCRSNLRPRTVELYEHLLKKHIKPFIGLSTLSGLTPSAVRDWNSELAGRYPSTAAKAYRLLATICKTAVDDEILLRSPCKIPGAGVEHAPERRIVGVAEVEALVEAMPERMALVVQLAAWAGMRRGEILALRRRDFDVLHHIVHIERTVHHMRGGAIVYGPPKTEAGARSIHYPITLSPIVEDHLNQYVNAHPDALVFTGEKNGALRPHVLYSKWTKARLSIGRPSLRLHDLRHTNATWTELGIVASSASLGRGRERPPTGEAVFLSVA